LLVEDLKTKLIETKTKLELAEQQVNCLDFYIILDLIRKWDFRSRKRSDTGRLAPLRDRSW
jgi:hypothetical protein